MSELRDAIAAAVEHDPDTYQDTYGAADAVLAIPKIRKALAVLALTPGIIDQLNEIAEMDRLRPSLILLAVEATAAALREAVES